MLEGDPLEEATFLRDEMANVAWAIEETVEGETGRPINRHEAWLATRSPEAPGSAQHTSFKLSTRVPDHWYPMIPVSLDPGNAGSIRFRRGTLVHDVEDVPPPPIGTLLKPNEPLYLFEEEIPRAGARVIRSWQLARSHDGSTALWVGKRKVRKRAPRASGLLFDLLTDPNE